LKVMFDGPNRPLACDRPDESYPAVWLQLQVRRFGNLPVFGAAIPSVIRHAETFPGMVRFGFDVDWGRGRFRTFGAFETEDSLRTYVTDGAHGAIYRRLRGRLGEVIVNYGKIANVQMPTTWDDIPEARFVKSKDFEHYSSI
jgi:hypothetical protein